MSVACSTDATPARIAFLTPCAVRVGSYPQSEVPGLIYRYRGLQLFQSEFL